MKLGVYDKLMDMQSSRRGVLKGAAGAAAALSASTVLSGIPTSAFAQDDLRAAILKIPGVGAGSPTDADWQKVGEMCLGATKQMSPKESLPGLN